MVNVLEIEIYLIKEQYLEQEAAKERMRQFKIWEREDRDMSGTHNCQITGITVSHCWKCG